MTYADHVLADGPLAYWQMNDSPTTTYFAAVMADSPWMYWRLNETAGPIADYGTEGMNLNVTGSPAFSQTGVIIDADTSTHFRNSASYGFFQYNDDAFYVEPPLVTTHDEEGPLAWSMEAWIYMNSNGTDHTGFGQANDIFKIIRPNAPDHVPLGFTVLNGIHVYVNVGTADYAGLGLNEFDELHMLNAVTVGAVYHLVFTYEATNFQGDNVHIDEGSGHWKFYVNGSQFSSGNIGSIRQHFMSITDDPHRNWFLIGHSGEHTTVQDPGILPTNGWSADARIDEVAFYKHVLTPEQIAHHYAVGTGSTSITAADSSGNGFTMAINSNFTISMGDPSFMNGDLLNTCATSTGSQPYIGSQASVLASVTNTNGQTLELWANYTQNGSLDDVFALTGSGASHLDRLHTDGKAYSSHFMSSRIAALATVPASGVHHFVWTRIQGGNHIMYIDSVQVGSSAANAFGVTGTFYCGGNGVALATTGSMAHIAIYNKVLTPAQVLDHYNAGIATFMKTFNVTQVPSTGLLLIRWYEGAFKIASHALLRAVYRARAAITQDRNLT